MEGGDAAVGFSRPEMFSEALAGSVKAALDRHIFAAWGQAEHWPGEMPDGCPERSWPRLLEATLKAAGKGCGSTFKLTFIEPAGDVAQGDVLVFPDYLRFRVSEKEGSPDLTALLALLSGGQVSSIATDLEDLAGSFAFVCAHTQRDPRCGHCGPRLVETLEEATNGKTSLQVFKCSHVGGHKFAGNIIVFNGKHTKDDGQWYGYVTPATAVAVVSGHAARGRLWRGRLGLGEAGALQERRAQWLKEAAPLFLAATIIAVAAASSFCAMWRRGRQ